MILSTLYVFPKVGWAQPLSLGQALLQHVFYILSTNLVADGTDFLSLEQKLTEQLIL